MKIRQPGRVARAFEQAGDFLPRPRARRAAGGRARDPRRRSRRSGSPGRARSAPAGALILASRRRGPRRPARRRRSRSLPCARGSRRASRASASASVRPDSRALMKLLTSSSAAGVVPASSETMRFSTLPSAPTSTASARAVVQRHEDSCLSRSSCFGTRTTPAQATGPTAPPTPPPAHPRSAGRGRSGARSRARSRGSGSAACMMPSTNRRSPLSVGMRPAEVCGWVSSPRSSRSCITLRIEAGDRLTLPVERLRPDRNAALEIGFDHQPENLAHAVGQFGDRLGHRHACI